MILVAADVEADRVIPGEIYPVANLILPQTSTTVLAPLEILLVSSRNLEDQLSKKQHVPESYTWRL
jgi:hypothetical protein